MSLLNINKMLLFIYITTFIIQKQQIISLLKKIDYILEYTKNVILI